MHVLSGKCKCEVKMFPAKVPVVLLVLKYSSNENQSHRRQDEIKLTDHSSVQLPRDEQMQSQHNNIDVNH